MFFHRVAGLAFIAAGFVVSVKAMDRKVPGYDTDGLLMFLSGGGIATFGMLLLTGY